jgi:hypothetical protein
MDAHLPTKDRKDLISSDDIDDGLEDESDKDPIEERDI